MSLRRFFGMGGGPRRPETRHPQPSWNGAVDATPIHAWLDAAGFPWRATRAELASRYGQGKDPLYSWGVVWVASEPPLLQGLIRPMSSQSHFDCTPNVPPAAFFGFTHFGGDARENVWRTAEELAPHLGTVKPADEANTFCATWSFGPAKVVLRSWPKDLRTAYPIPPTEAEKRDRRLARACHVTIETGWRASLSDAERAWLETFQPLRTMQPARPDSAQAMRNRPTHDHGLEFVRLLPEGFDHLIDRIGISADGQALITARGQLSIIPTGRVEGLRVTQTHPGRSSGNEVIDAIVRTDGAASPTIAVTLEGRDVYIGDLDDVGRELAAKLGLSIEVIDAGEDNY